MILRQSTPEKLNARGITTPADVAEINFIEMKYAC
jgi:hypothetical protein